MHGQHPRRPEDIYNWDEKIDEATGKVEGHMCYTTEWFAEELPLENKEGSAMAEHMEKILHECQEPDEFYEFVRPPPPKKLDVPKIEVPPRPKERVLIFTDNHGWCDGIVKGAPEGRIGKKQIVDKPPSELSQDDVKSLLKPGWDLIIYAYGLNRPATNCSADVIDFNTDISRLYFFILQETQRNIEKLGRLAVITADCFAVDAQIHQEVGLGLIAASTFIGMTNTARIELSADKDFPIQYIDVCYHLKGPRWDDNRHADDARLMELLCSEVFRTQSFGHNTVRLNRDGRFVQRQLMSKPYEVAKAEFDLPEEGDIVGISGGNGALAIVMGNWFLDKCEKEKATGFEIQFLSRSMKVSDLNMPGWKKIQKKAEKLGIKVEQARLDMGTQEAMDEYVERCNGKLFGFIHSAGVLADTMLMNQTWEKFEQVYASKHRPALFLHESLQKFPQENLTFCWLFSSVAVQGSPGQMNYSGSNSFLDALARHRVALDMAGMAVQWGPWGEVGMAATMDDLNRKRYEQGPMPFFATKEGTAGLDIGLTTGLPNISVFKYNPGPMFKMIEHTRDVAGKFSRNFTAEILPTPMAPGLQNDNLMCCVRTGAGSYVERKRPDDWHCFYAYVAPDLDDNYDEGDETDGTA